MNCPQCKSANPAGAIGPVIFFVKFNMPFGNNYNRLHLVEASIVLGRAIPDVFLLVVKSKIRNNQVGGIGTFGNFCFARSHNIFSIVFHPVFPDHVFAQISC